MAYIGAIYIPEIKNMPENKGRDVSVIHGINLSSPVTVGHMPGLMRVKVDGILYKPSGTVKTPKQYAEDIRALLRDPSYNYLNFAARTGYLAPTGIPTIDTAAPLTQRIPFSLNALFHSDAQFQRRFRSDPEILTNDFSLTFGAGGCDNYIPLPIGSTYSGGDSSTITRAGKDGTTTLVKANTSNNINFDLAADEVNVGECKVWDSVIAGDTNEANWIRVFNKDHKFTGDWVIENNQIRLLKSGDFVRLYKYISSAWYYFAYFNFQQYTPTDLKVMRWIKITTLTPDIIKIKVFFQRVDLSGDDADCDIIINRDGIAEIIQNTNNNDDLRLIITHQNMPRFGVDANYSILDTIFGDAMYYGSNDNYVTWINLNKDMIMTYAYNKKQGTQGLFVRLVTGSYLTYLSNINVVEPWSIFIAVPDFSSTANLFKECEAMTQGSGVTFYTGVDASPKTGNTGSTLNAQNEEVDYTQAASNLGHGATGNSTYKLFVRAKDSAQVANDLRVKVENTTDATVLANVTKTLTAAWAYYSVDVTLSSTDATTDNIKVTLSKDTATANAIDLDYVLWIPITLDNGNGPQQIAHQALVNQNLVRDLIQR